MHTADQTLPYEIALAVAVCTLLVSIGPWLSDYYLVYSLVAFILIVVTMETIEHFGMTTILLSLMKRDRIKNGKLTRGRAIRYLSTNKSPESRKKIAEVENRRKTIKKSRFKNRSEKLDMWNETEI